ncbi:MAG: XTP/dITP diphosphatase [Clostridiaceae bacterium]|nr:XTP/dITP diphosphatase [Clostridiaceae bacterium]
MRNLVIATKNRGKLREIKEILSDIPFSIISVEDINPGMDIVIEETGKTYEENALIKARKVCELTGEISMADDSGLEVFYLGGTPGVHTSRFGGEKATDSEKNQKILKMLEGVPFEERKARFVCAIAVVYPGGEHFVVRGTCNGYINLKPEGSHGFGYDPIFYLPEYGMTTAQMNPEDKHKISHRGKALRLAAEELKKRESE